MEATEWEVHQDGACQFEAGGSDTRTWDSTEYILTIEKKVEPYQGGYEITPTDEAQVVPIGGLMALEDITVKPIPSNYGLITWDGSTITVS